MIADLIRDLLAALAKLASKDRLVPLVIYNRQPTQGLGQDRVLGIPLRCINGGVIPLHSLDHAAASLVGSSFP
jgi:hypothetical protein